MSTLETLISYTPTFIQRRFVQPTSHALAPTAERYQAAALLIEIVHLTYLSEEFIQKNPASHASLPQPLPDWVYNPIPPLLDLLTAHGGELVRFAGDTLLVLWPVGETGKDLATVTRRAAACALALENWQRTQTSWAVMENQMPAQPLDDFQLRMVLASGDIWAGLVGGVDNHWELLIASDLLIQLHQAQTPNQLVSVAPDTWPLLEQYAQAEPLANGYVHLQQLHQPLPPCAASPVMLPPETEDVLRSYVSPVVLAQVDAGEQAWFAEQCEVTALFLQITGLDYQQADILMQVQDAVYELQQIIHYYQGQLLRLQVDEKGTVLVAVWGIPLTQVINKSLYSVYAAQRIEMVLQDQDLLAHIGICTGSVFCVTRGNADYRQFDLIGQVMQRASYLMHTAYQKILVDEPTYQATHRFLEFETLSPISLPLENRFIRLYQPLLFFPDYQPLIGRRAERQQLLNDLQTLHQQGKNRIVLIEGEPGMGKTRLVNDLVWQTKSSQFFFAPLPALQNNPHRFGGLTCLRCVAHPGDPAIIPSPFYAWRQLFIQLFNQEFSGYNPAQQCTQMLRRLYAFPAIAARFPLLNSVLPLQLPDNRLTEQMTKQIRLDNTYALLIALLQDFVRHSKTRYIFIFEDVHQLDSASWALLYHVSQRVQPLMLVLTTQPFAPHSRLAYPILQQSQVRTLSLQSLDEQEMTVFLYHRLGVVHLPDALRRLILEKAQGNPLLAEEIIYELQDYGIIYIVDGQCQIRVAHPLNSEDYPDNLQTIIYNRMQQLTYSAKLALQVASVIGQEINLKLLEKVYTYFAPPHELIPALNHLEKLHFISITSDKRFAQFRHSMLQSAAYESSLTLLQRKQLHRLVARWYEKAQDLSTYYAVLAYHWKHAQMPEKAVDYLEKAGQQALENYANQEAIKFFTQALQLDDIQDDAEKVPLLRKANWAIALGEAYFHLGKYVESRTAVQLALESVNLAPPKTQWGLRWRLTREITRQALHRRRPDHYLGSQVVDKERLLMAATAYERLIYLTHIEQNPWAYLNASLRFLNLVELADPHSPMVARAYANMNMALMRLQRRQWQEWYYHQALERCKQTSDLNSVSWVFVLVSIYDASQGIWIQSENRLTQTLKSAEYLGDTRRQLETMNLLAQLDYYQGRFREGLKKAQMIYTVGQQRRDLQAQVWGLSQQGLCALRLGETDLAIENLKVIQTLPSEQFKFAEAIQVCGLLTLVYAQQTMPKQAIQMANKTRQLIAKAPLPTLELLESYASVAQIYLMQWEKYLEQRSLQGMKDQLLSKEIFAFAKLSKQACGTLNHYAKIFPIAQPRAWLWLGLQAWLTGKERQAHRYWQRSLERALQLEMPYERGLAHYEIARHSPLDAPLRQEHFQQAKIIFDRLDAHSDLQKLQSYTF